MFQSAVLPLVVTGLLLSSGIVLAQQNASPGPVSGLHTDFIYSSGKRLVQEVYITTTRAITKDSPLLLQLVCYRYPATGDSLLVYRNKQTLKPLKSGTSVVRIPFYGNDAQYYILPVFERILKQSEIVPAGHYKIFVSVRQKDSLVYQRDLLWQKDSILELQSPLRKGIPGLLHSNTPLKTADNPAAAFERSRFRLERYFRKKKLSPRQYRQEGKEVIDLFSEDWFVARYEMRSDASVSEEVKKEKDRLDNRFGSLTHNGLGDYPSLRSQFRDIKKSNKDHKERTGELGLATYFSNDQEPNSQQDNSYQEIRGGLEFPIADIPFTVAGYYTTQDRRREAKASFIRFRYDAEKAKEQLMKLIGSYRQRFEQTRSQATNLDMIYGNYIRELSSEKDKATGGLQQQLNMPASAGLDEAALKEVLKNKAGTAADTGSNTKDKVAKAQELKAKTEAQYQKAMEQYQRIQELDRQIKKYQFLLDQYKNTARYDSLLNYDKLDDLKELENASYKDLAKRASGLLPDNKAKGLITGLTSFEAGMFPKYVSDYTLSGQTLKGADIGYDIGFAEAGASYGKTEYLTRDGQKENYRSYSGRLQFKPLWKQSLGLVYFGYSPEKQLLQDSRFSNIAVGLPSFRNPVHILSATYTGQVSDRVKISGEYAVSERAGQSEAAAKQLSFKDRSAGNLKLEGQLPFVPVNLEAGYEQVGAAFKNNTLPVIMAGTERFLVKGKTDLFRGFLTTGIEYNYLIQNNFNTSGSNSRWGFEVATHSKRWPSVLLSYKPFSSFRSPTDTQAVPQKPVLGSVWTGRINYQVKKLDRALRFTLLCNRNNSIMDTVRYNSMLYQFSTTYSSGSNMLTLNLGTTDVQTEGVETANPAFNHSRFMSLGASGSVMPQLTVSGGGDLATTPMGISRYGCFAGTGYTFKKKPLMIRTLFRYSNYRLSESSGWKQLYSGSIELSWRFKLKPYE